VPHVIKTPYTVDVYDLMHRPGEMRERSIDIVVPEEFGNAMIAVKAGSDLRVDLRMESLHDGILVSADIDGTAAGECGRCLIDIEQAVQVEIQELFAYSSDEAFEYEVHEDVPAGLSRRLPRPVPAVWGAAPRQPGSRARESRRSTMGGSRKPGRF